jgi:hypothetical protein
MKMISRTRQISTNGVTLISLRRVGGFKEGWTAIRRFRGLDPSDVDPRSARRHADEASDEEAPSVRSAAHDRSASPSSSPCLGHAPAQGICCAHLPGGPRSSGFHLVVSSGASQVLKHELGPEATGRGPDRRGRRGGRRRREDRRPSRQRARRADRVGLVSPRRHRRSAVQLRHARRVRDRRRAHVDPSRGRGGAQGGLAVGARLP